MRPCSAQRCSVGKHLAGIEQPLASKAHLTAMLLGEIDFVEHLRHQVALLDADAMFAGQHAADLDAEPQNMSAPKSSARCEFAGLVRVEEDERMQIAVAGMKHIGDAQPVLFGQLRACPPAPSAARWRGIVPSMQR